MQIFFVGDVDDPSENDSGWLHGFHGGLAILLFLLAVWIAARDFETARGVTAARGDRTAASS